MIWKVLKKFMALMRNLRKIISFLVPILPYILLILTLAFGGTYAYKKIYSFVTGFVDDVNTSISDVRGTIRDLENEQSRLIHGIEIYVDSTERELAALDRSLAERQAELADRERRNRESEYYLQERFRELREINAGSDYIIRLTDELAYRYYNGELEISVYEYLKGEQEVED